MKYYFVIASPIMGLLGNKEIKKTTTKMPKLAQLITHHYTLEKVTYYSFTPTTMILSVISNNHLSFRLHIDIISVHTYPHKRGTKSSHKITPHFHELLDCKPCRGGITRKVGSQRIFFT